MQLLDDLGRTVERVTEVVPECIGLSVARADHETMLTIAVSDEVIAVLDAVQYLDGGPGVESVRRRRWGETRLTDVATSQRWPLFGQACARAGVRSTLTVPVTENGVLAIGTLHAYARTERAFEGREKVLAHAFEGAAHDLVIRSTDSLTSRRMIEHAPRSLRGEGAVNRAIGSLAVHVDIDVTTAYERLTDAAVRAGIGPDRLALALVELGR